MNRRQLLKLGALATAAPHAMAAAPLCSVAPTTTIMFKSGEWWISGDVGVWERFLEGVELGIKFIDSGGSEENEEKEKGT